MQDNTIKLNDSNTINCLKIPLVYKQLNDQYQARVENLLLNGATLEEAEMFAQAETPVEDVQSLEKLQKELAILTLDPTTLPIDL